ncbi:hypothetical protein P389DRAFT_179045 [Cystobasidium minutum MCA 4210]|uniref:uncharacterized protein n=1 Tax=Cystobasidium minutum MCA 4210 TaxID=1397322 RepID=UPI0034CF1C63|eukprot:jgi/Rhomi1/179045/fgenesh1_pg.3_\
MSARVQSISHDTRAAEFCAHNYEQARRDVQRILQHLDQSMAARGLLNATAAFIAPGCPDFQQQAARPEGYRSDPDVRIFADVDTVIKHYFGVKRPLYVGTYTKLIEQWQDAYRPTNTKSDALDLVRLTGHVSELHRIRQEMQKLEIEVRNLAKQFHALEKVSRKLHAALGRSDHARVMNQ